MELLDRYLEAVRKLLPWKRQDDIIAELRANLEAQLEDKETKLGRPLTPEEAKSWLRELGSPMQMASLYQPQQYLIGPRYFPLYWMVMRQALCWYSVVYALVGVVQDAVQEYPLRALLGTAARLPLALLIVAGCVTASFAVMEFLVTRFPERFGKAGLEWSPASLPPAPRIPATPLKPQTKTKAIGELISSILVLVFWLVAPRHPFLVMGPTVQYLHLAPFRPAPVCWQFYGWVVWLSLVNIAWQATELALGSWQRSRGVRELIWLALALIPQAIMLFAPGHAYLVLRIPELGTRFGTVLRQINHGIYVLFAFIFVLTILQLLFRVGKLVREYRKQLAQA